MKAQKTHKLFLVILVFVLQLAGLTTLTATDASARTSDGGGQEGDMYSPAKEHLFKEAARQYWLKHGWDPGEYCSPYEVDIIYGFYDPDFIARVSEIGDGKRSYKGLASYCKTWFNKLHKESTRNACVTFIHEFGHLMGRVHNDNIESPMNARYAYWNTDLTLSQRQRLFARWKKNIVGKTTCNAVDLKKN